MQGVGPSPIAYAIPFFFALIGLELWATRRKRLLAYRLPDTLADLGTGVFQQCVGVFTRVASAGLYLWVYDHRLFEVPNDSVLGWVACAIAVDFAYYWFHRASHQVNFLWAAHVVHHQSEDYHLAVALRQSAIQPLFSLWFYMPLALLGFSPLMAFTVIALNTLYQFWIHTELIGRMGVLEKVLNTPSHHRVHHGRNPVYIDKNHGGSLILWDKWFGTFEPEGERLIYGITRPVRSWNAVWANLHPWRDLAWMVRHTPRWSDKLRVIFSKPGWHPPGLPGLPEDFYARLDDPKFEPAAPRSYRLYALAQFVPAVVAALVLLVRTRPGVDGLDGALGAFVVATLINVGGWLEARRWVTWAEPARLIVTTAMVSEAIRRGLLVGWVAVACALALVASVVGLLYALRARPDDVPRGISVDEGALP